MKKIILAFLFFLCASGAFANDNITPLEPIRKSDRILILAPHPDDESIACAGVIQEAIKAGADIHVLYLTNGDANELAFIVYEKRLVFRKGAFIYMGEVRQKESVAAMKSLGIDENNLIFLGYPDWGTFSIFRDYWQTDKPFTSLLTRSSSVPYKNNFSFGSPYVGESILEDIKNTLKKYRPNKIFVSHSLDVNYDHKALSLFLEVALADLKYELPDIKVYPYLVHWSNWPSPRDYHPELGFFPPIQFKGSEVEWKSLSISPENLEKKHQAILCYKSQTQSSAFYLLAFARKDELFGTFPEINIDLNPVEVKLNFQENDNSFTQMLRNVFSTAEKMAKISLKEPSNEEELSRHCPVEYSVKDNIFLIHIDKGEDLSPGFRALIYLFGYNYKTPFSQMPKIRLVAKHKDLKVYNGDKLIGAQGISFERTHKELTFKVPLTLLGNPDFILASVKGSIGISCIDTLAFRKINLIRGKNAGPKISENKKAR